MFEQIVATQDKSNSKDEPNNGSQQWGDMDIAVDTMLKFLIRSFDPFLAVNISGEDKNKFSKDACTVCS